MKPAFAPFTAQHLIAVAVVAVLTAALVVWTRRQSPEGAARAARAFAVVLLAYYGIESVVRVAVLDLRVWDTLPFEMCSALFFIGAFAFWAQAPLAFEIVYFWTFAGTLHSLITPTPRAGWPDLSYFQYFTAHGLLIMSATFAALGLKKVPTRGSFTRAFVALQVFTLAVAGVDLLTGENYLYLRRPPPSPNVLDVFGPWPWYIVGGEVIALFSFFLWSLPFGWRRKS